MALLKRTMHPHQHSASTRAEYTDNLSEWLKAVRELRTRRAKIHERICRKELDETVKTATLIEEAPPQLQDQLKLRSKELGTGYKKVVVATRLRSRLGCS